MLRVERSRRVDSATRLGLIIHFIKARCLPELQLSVDLLSSEDEIIFVTLPRDSGGQLGLTFSIGTCIWKATMSLDRVGGLRFAVAEVASSGTNVPMGRPSGPPL
jgi:hypothetical protein